MNPQRIHNFRQQLENRERVIEGLESENASLRTSVNLSQQVLDCAITVGNEMDQESKEKLRELETKLAEMTAERDEWKRRATNRLGFWKDAAEKASAELDNAKVQLKMEHENLELAEKKARQLEDDLRDSKEVLERMRSFWDESATKLQSLVDELHVSAEHIDLE